MPEDKTTRSGEVISASPTIIEGRNIALNGDMAWCPIETCNGLFQINGFAYYLAQKSPGYPFEECRKRVTKQIC